MEQRQDSRAAVVRRWSRHPSCVGLARGELRKALASWGLTSLEDSAVLVLSELLTNAGRHTHVSSGPEIETCYVPMTGGLRIEVHDPSAEQPELRSADVGACDGRGLVLVAALADAWGVGERDGGRPGKAVWAELFAGGAR
ncbi:ATP-binding protein [Streptomyces odonnellii]|uniref:ATP-binding protein n=1 Tax=Streptomyces odonnellii TaxID=1417980 RepID=UPI0006253A42|nr:ATP-binding protein [Streptomyces odonnellii]